MAVSRAIGSIFVAFASVIATQAQDTPPMAPQLMQRSSRSERPATPFTPQTIALTVPKGTSLQVALADEMRVRKVGQSVDALLVEPIYAFDRLVVPVGSKIRGEVTRIEPLSNGRRILADLDGDFTPARKIEIRFTDLVLSDGKHMSLHTSVTPGSGQILKLVSAPDKESKKARSNKAGELKKTLNDAATEKTKEAKQLAKDQWNNAMKQLKTPGRIHRLQRYAETQLPVHRQYIPAGTMYFAELEEPLDFGSEPLTPEMAASLGSPLPEGSVVNARLTTLLSSETAQKGQEVEAVLTRPLFDGEKLLLPQGSRLMGTVRQVQAARRMKKNGQLRIAFQQVVPPDGIEQKVQAALVGVQAGKDGNVKLDSEGGAEATTSKSRYGSLALSLGLAAASARVGDRDGERAGSSNSTGGSVAGGVGGFKLVGAVVGALVQSRSFGYTMGAYGAGMSVYRNFLARGHEVVFPKNTAMEVGIGTRAGGSTPTPVPPSPSEDLKGQ